MRTIYLTAILLLASVAASAQTTYIPTYRSYLHIVTGNDTISVANNLDTLELAEPGGMFALRLDQEDVTKEKVKAIKRAKRAAGWATFSAIMSGISTAFSDNTLEYIVRRENTRMVAELADFYRANAKEKQILEIVMYVDNTSDHELMVCDMERGLTWWIQPRQTMRLKLNNPEVSNMRISDPQSTTVRFATVMAGSKVTKWEIDLETDEYWFSPVYRWENKPHDDANIIHYIRISKADYTETKVGKDEFIDLKRAIRKSKK